MIDDYVRPDSPIYENDLEEEGRKKRDKILRFRTDYEKIHRIRCLAEYYASVVDVVSPSEIWLQHFNHIADNLTEPLDGTQLSINPHDLRLKMYVLAPLNKDVLARARIIDILHDDRVFVRFIDHGFVAMFKSHMFFEMSQSYRTYPWQTVAVTLFGAYPYKNESWSTKEVDAIKSLLKSYEMFWIVPKFTQNEILDDSQFTRVEMYGLSSEDIEIIENSNQSIFSLGDGILELFYQNVENRIDSLIIDAYEQLYYPYFDDHKYDEHPYHVDDIEIKVKNSISTADEGSDYGTINGDKREEINDEFDDDVEEEDEVESDNESVSDHSHVSEV